MANKIKNQLPKGYGSWTELFDELTANHPHIMDGRDDFEFTPSPHREMGRAKYEGTAGVPVYEMDIDYMKARVGEELFKAIGHIGMEGARYIHHAIQAAFCHAQGRATEDTNRKCDQAVWSLLKLFSRVK